MTKDTALRRKGLERAGEDGIKRVGLSLMEICEDAILIECWQDRKWDTRVRDMVYVVGWQCFPRRFIDKSRAIYILYICIYDFGLFLMPRLHSFQCGAAD